MGMGPMTGRGAGYCGGYYGPGWAHPGPRRGFGRAWGWGRGRWHRHGHHRAGWPGWAHFGYGPAWGAPPVEAYGPYGPYAQAPSREQEAEFLRQQAEWLRQQLDAIDRRLEELEQEA
jgi:hypothetical protein